MKRREGIETGGGGMVLKREGRKREGKGIKREEWWPKIKKGGGKRGKEGEEREKR
jgi:hypothetical protein